MPKRFSAAMALWITPDFTEVEAGRRNPPYVNHSKVDFEAVAAFLSETFSYGPHVEIRAPNDTIDQVTIHSRVDRSNGPTMRGEDFGTEMLRCARSTKGSVVDVRKAWRSLHVLKDRDSAPPPVILPFVVEARDFEDAMIWHANAMPILGLPFLPPQLRAIAGLNEEEERQGMIDVKTRQSLEEIFGCPYKEFALLDRMAMDKIPKEYE